ncbi:MAG: MFS transporter, partial [Thermoplasmata archaeon]|nr:MFS transporter [Thermoplasmata archaeon]
MKPQTIQFLSSAGTFGPAVIVPVILADEYGASNGVIGLVAGSFAAASLLSTYMFGRASDVHGRRLILVIGLLASAFATLGQAFTILTDSLLLFTIVRVLLGFCAGTFPAALLAYAYENKNKMGRFSSWGAAGWGIGSLSVGLFGTMYVAAHIYCAAILFISYAVALKLTFAPTGKMRVPLFPIALIRQNAPVYASVLIRHTGANMVWVTYPLFLISIGADGLWVGLIYAVNAFAQFFIMKQLDRYDPARLVGFGIALSSVTFATYLFVDEYWKIIPSQILLAISWACLYVGSLRYVMDKSREKATATGMLSGTISIAGIIGPLIGGVCAATIGFGGTIAIAS